MNDHARSARRSRSWVFENWGALVLAVLVLLMGSGCVSDSNGRRTRNSEGDKVSLAERVKATNEALGTERREQVDSQGGIGDAFSAEGGRGRIDDAKGFDPLNYVYIGLAVLVLIWLYQVVAQVKRERHQHENP